MHHAVAAVNNNTWMDEVARTFGSEGAKLDRAPGRTVDAEQDFPYCGQSNECCRQIAEFP